MGFRIYSPALKKAYANLVDLHKQDDESLRTKLAQIYPIQSNVTFNVNSRSSYRFHYDLDNDGKMHYDRWTDFAPNGANVGCYMCVPNGELSSLYIDFINSKNNKDFLDAWNAASRGTYFWGFYVNLIADPLITGYSSAGDSSLPAIVQTFFPKGTKPLYVETTTAHEFGHILGRGKRIDVVQSDGTTKKVKTPGHTNEDSNTLMQPLTATDAESMPCRLTRDDWNIMNYVQGSPVKEEQP